RAKASLQPQSAHTLSPSWPYLASWETYGLLLHILMRIGITIVPEKEFVMILTPKEKAGEVLEAIPPV
ncbi:MAG: hypothetical protein LBB60_10095, partial [Desulfovibrio sp.]|nr:hypothetical protein [Desulfovibrio sp.]